jgi:hypothetical protein
MAVALGKKQYMSDACHFRGFSPQHGNVRGIFGKPKARVLPLKRRSKKHVAGNVAQRISRGMTKRRNLYGTCLVLINTSTWRLTTGECCAGSAKQ